MCNVNIICVTSPKFMATIFLFLSNFIESCWNATLIENADSVEASDLHESPRETVQKKCPFVREIPTENHYTGNLKDDSLHSEESYPGDSSLVQKTINNEPSSVLMNEVSLPGQQDDENTVKIDFQLFSNVYVQSNDDKSSNTANRKINEMESHDDTLKQNPSSFKSTDQKEEAIRYRFFFSNLGEIPSTQVQYLLNLFDSRCLEPFHHLDANMIEHESNINYLRGVFIYCFANGLVSTIANYCFRIYFLKNFHKRNGVWLYEDINRRSYKMIPTLTLDLISHTDQKVSIIILGSCYNKTSHFTLFTFEVPLVYEQHIQLRDNKTSSGISSEYDKKRCMLMILSSILKKYPKIQDKKKIRYDKHYFNLNKTSLNLQILKCIRESTIVYHFGRKYVLKYMGMSFKNILFSLYDDSYEYMNMAYCSKFLVDKFPEMEEYICSNII